MDDGQRMHAVVGFLKERYGKRIKPRRGNAFRLLVSTILSQRTRDENSSAAAEKLFEVADTPEEISAISVNVLKPLIRQSGFYNQKAKRIRMMCRALVKRHDGNVPRTRNELLSLPGVGFKTADVVLCYGFGVPTIPIDTHCNRIIKRLGFAKPYADVEEVRMVAENLVPPRERYVVNVGMIMFGREICKRIPLCYVCPISRACMKVGVPRVSKTKAVLKHAKPELLESLGVKPHILAAIAEIP